MTCRKCNSFNIAFWKALGYGPKMGKVFHYGVKCKSCGARYHVERTKEVYEKVKGLSWQTSKQFRLMQSGLAGMSVGTHGITNPRAAS